MPNLSRYNGRIGYGTSSPAAMIVSAAMPVRTMTARLRVIAAVEDLFLLWREGVVERLEGRLLRRQIRKTALQSLLHARLALDHAVAVPLAHRVPKWRDVQAMNNGF